MMENLDEFIKQLIFQCFWLFPGELGATKVTICSSVAVNRFEQIQFLDNNTRSKIKVVLDDLQQFCIALFSSSIGVNKDRSWFSYTNGI